MPVHIYIPKLEDGVIQQFDGYFDLEDATLIAREDFYMKEYWGGVSVNN